MTGNLDASFILRETKLDLMSHSFDKKSNIPETTQKQKAEQLKFSDSTNKIYRDQINKSGPRNKKNTKRQKMRSQAVSIT